jgi:Domain of unknown function (DUF5979)
MENTLRVRGWVRRTGLLCGVAGLLLFGVAATAAASRPVPQQVGILPLLLRSAPSDPRAAFHDGNAVTCAQAGITTSTDQVGAHGDASASDGNVAGVPAPNTGPIQPGQGEELNVSVVPDVVVDGVVVKGGNGYNVYSNPQVLPPTLPPPQHYISPFNGGGNVPDLSHWFVCYHLTTPPPPVGSLTVKKVVISASAPPSAPLPTAFTAIVNCNDGVHVNIPVAFGVGGGRSTGGTITGITPGTVCTVVEDTASLPAGTVVTYNPAGADTTGVTIAANAGVEVTVTNDFSGLTPQSGNLQLVKQLLPAPPGVTLPASYTARVLCDDGTDTNVTLPGTGGPGTPPVSVDADALCAVGEDIAGLPAGWVLTYSVDGGAPTSSPPVFVVTANATVTVTITNDPSAAAETTVPTTPEPTAAPTMPGTLPPTGSGLSAAATVGVVLVAVGLVALGYAARRRPSGES